MTKMHCSQPNNRWIRLSSLSILIATLLLSCVIDSEELEDESSLGVESSCGELSVEEGEILMARVGLRYGYKRPFEAANADGSRSDPLELPMEYGLQGGHHVDLSLRFIGDLNPDRVDISIELKVDEPLADLYYGQHDTRSWYLLFPDEDEADGCYFHQARIFLFDLEGSPVEPLGVAMLDGLGAQLTISLTSEDLSYEWVARGILRDAVNQ